jgi:maltooligosyltrehalose synthase
METRSAPPGRSDSDKKKRPAAEFFPAAVESVALVALVAAHAVVLADATEISLVHTVLTLTVPGVPDIYQGAELWEQSLVDPDNRLPVDFQRRADLLDTPFYRWLSQTPSRS